jgi:hypothetical protein
MIAIIVYPFYNKHFQNKNKLQVTGCKFQGTCNLKPVT